MKRLVPFRKSITNAALSVVMLLVAGLAMGQTPTITSVTHNVVTKNTRVTILGNNFGNNANVTIGGVASGTTTFGYVGTRTNTKIVLSISSSTSAVPVNGVIRVTRTAAPAGNFVDSSTSISYITPVVKGTADGVRVQELYTDFNTFWKSGTPVSTVRPNTRHNLLGFKYNNVIYSTGVNDQRLIDNGLTVNPQSYRAYSTRGVEGATNSQLYLAMADLIDGSTNTVFSPTEIQGLSVWDVLIDGENGLDIGTGITNFNTDASISFFSDNAQINSGTFITDDVPDVLITQIADPGGTTNLDFYHFSDVNGNIVGTPVQMNMSSIARLGAYDLDLFKFPAGDLATAETNGVGPYGNNEQRDIRIVGLRFSDFGITTSNYNQIHSFDMLAGGAADIAFLAYNTASFHIESPIVTSAPNSVRICSLPYNHDVTFSVGAAIQGGGTGTLNYKWKKNNTDILASDVNYSGENTATLTVHGPITSALLATYKVEISNEFGAIVASSAALRQGGTPVVWNGTNWNATPTSVSSLIFNGNYDSAINLPSGTKIEGCDCKVQNGISVVIDSGDTMILQNSIEVAPEIPAHNEPQYDGGGNYIGDIWVNTQPAGTYTLRNNASLIQVNEEAANIGTITKIRTATGLHPLDYVYWSAPVSGFNISGLASYSTPMYQWSPTTLNPNGTYGTWTAASGIMTPAKGYIARISGSNPSHTVTFHGAPNNGVYNVALTGNTNANAGTNYWNLVGNPYPSPIRASDFINSNTAIEGNVRLWTHNTAISNAPGNNPFYNNFTYNYGDQYITYNGTASVPAGFNGYIASGQGFFVQGKSTTGTVTFQNTFRYKETLPTYNNSQFYRQAAPTYEVSALDENELPEQPVDKSVIWLSLVNASNVSTNTAVGYVDGATNEKDRVFDASMEPAGFSVYSLVGADPVIIQGRNWPFVDSDVVPLGFSVATAGVYQFAIDRVSGVFEDVDQNIGIFIKDKSLNVTHDLRQSPYSFTSEIAGNFADRFELLYETSALGTNDEDATQTFAFIANQTLQVQSINGLKKIEVYDITGKMVNTYNVASGDTRFASDFTNADGFYLAKITLTNGTVVTRKMVTN